MIYSVTVFTTEFEPDVVFEVQARNPPTNPNLACPLVNDCGFPANCVGGIACHINPTAPKACEVQVAVQEHSWSGVKELYRE